MDLYHRSLSHCVQDSCDSWILDEVGVSTGLPMSWTFKQGDSSGLSDPLQGLFISRFTAYTHHYTHHLHGVDLETQIPFVPKFQCKT